MDMRVGKPPAKRSGTRDSTRTRATILAAATEEFTTKGLKGARVDAIARRSGANKRMIYHYFGNKEGLYLAVLETAYAAHPHRRDRPQCSSSATPFRTACAS